MQCTEKTRARPWLWWVLITTTTIVQQGQGEWRVHNFTEDGDVTGDVSDQEKDVDEEHGHLPPRQEVAVVGGQKECQAVVWQGGQGVDLTARSPFRKRYDYFMSWRCVRWFSMWNLFRETSTTIIRKFCVREGFKKKIVEFSTKRLTPPP